MNKARQETDLTRLRREFSDLMRQAKLADRLGDKRTARDLSRQAKALQPAISRAYKESFK